ncbi:hypothetical protein [Tessaracoccus sp. MC1756]|uniref:hypothetical protein n=1 Tax=Tessaracoccus sp. MC1756 TaxID=2760311 RepID=UPI0016031191|nr:hypothetical protein [Tessaracoccus sp. MC1756]MBB1509262.1 hypothetical protein [Tessaracoccus sp. MC1756]
MSLELTGVASEHFETRPRADGFEMTGDGRLRHLSVEFGDGWTLLDDTVDDAGAELRHTSGVTGSVRLSSGPRLRLQVNLTSEIDDTVTVPGPLLRVVGEKAPISWLAEASGEIVLPSEHGPGLLTQRRGLSSDGPEPGTAYLLEAEPLLRPKSVLSSAWTYEALEGDILDMPLEPSWFPFDRYPGVGHGVELSVPDGLVVADESVRVTDTDGEFELYPPPGLSRVGVWGPGGRTLLEIGSHLDPEQLREKLAGERFVDDAWAYVAVRHMMESWTPDDLVDRVDFVLGQVLEKPTAWGAVAAHLATQLGLPLEQEAQEAATQVLSRGRVDEVIVLTMHGMVPIDLAGGAWPVGNFRELGIEAMSRIGYGRVRSAGAPVRGRDVAVAKLFAAGLGETEQGLRASSCAMMAEHRLLCWLSAQQSPVDLAWLSVG